MKSKTFKIVLAISLIIIVVSGSVILAVLLRNKNSDTNIPTDHNYEASEEFSDEYTDEYSDGFQSDYREGYENENGNTHANLCNNGIAAEQDGWIYHYVRIGNSNGKGSTSTIYKHKSDSATETVVAQLDVYISKISVKGDYIYFLYGGKELYRIRTDGTMMEDVFVNENHVDEKNYMIVGDYIYTTKEEQHSSVSYSTWVVRYDINNTSSSEKVYKLNEEDTYYGVTGNYVVTKQKSESFVEDVLWIYNMETGDIAKHTCASGVFCYNVQLCDDAVYYTNNYYNAVVKLDLTDMSVSVAENENLSINSINFIDENKIYLKQGNWMWSSTMLVEASFSMLENGKCYEILEEEPKDICVVGDWIYYTSGSYGMENYCRVKNDGTQWEMLYAHS